MDKQRIFTREDWLSACKKLLPFKTDAEREKLYEDTFKDEEKKPDPFLEAIWKNDV